MHTVKVYGDDTALEIIRRMMNFGAPVTLEYAGHGHWTLSSASPWLVTFDNQLRGLVL